MVKASKWFRKLLMIRSGPAEPKSSPSSSSSSSSSRDYTQPSHSYAKRKEKEKHSMRWNVGRGRAILHGSDDDDDDDNVAAEVVQVQQNRVENRQAGVAIAVAAATVAAADAAVSAAQAAAKLVHLSSINGHFFILDGGIINREQWAAIRIQSAFRGYLSQRAIRALKGVVKLQALVRGQMVRRQAAVTLRCMQSLLRVQAKVQAQRNTLLKCAHQYETNNYKQERPLEEERNKVGTSIEDLERKGAHKISQKTNVYMASPGFPFPHQLERSVDNGDVEKGRSWLDHRWTFATRTLGNSIFDSNATDHRDEGAKIVEMDTAKVVKKKRNDSMSEPCSPFSPRNLSSSPSPTMGSPNNNNKNNKDNKNNNNIPTILNKPFMGEEEGGRRRRLRHLRGVDEDYYPREIFHSNNNNNNRTNNNHNHNSSISSGSSIISSSIGTPLPNYMTTTHSSKAKLRSLSEPKQRPESQLVLLRTRHSLMAQNEKEPPKQRPAYSSLVNSKGGNMQGLISVGYNSTTSLKERHYSRH